MSQPRRYRICHCYMGVCDGRPVRYPDGTVYLVRPTGWINQNRELKRRERAIQAVALAPVGSEEFRAGAQHRTMDPKFLGTVIQAIEKDPKHEPARVSALKLALLRKAAA